MIPLIWQGQVVRMEGRVSANNILFLLVHLLVFYVNKDSRKSIRHEERAHGEQPRRTQKCLDSADEPQDLLCC